MLSWLFPVKFSMNYMKKLRLGLRHRQAWFITPVICLYLPYSALICFCLPWSILICFLALHLFDLNCGASPTLPFLHCLFALPCLPLYCIDLHWSAFAYLCLLWSAFDCILFVFAVICLCVLWSALAWLCLPWFILLALIYLDLPELPYLPLLDFACFDLV